MVWRHKDTPIAWRYKDPHDKRLQVAAQSWRSRQQLEQEPKRGWEDHLPENNH